AYMLAAAQRTCGKRCRIPPYRRTKALAVEMNRPSGRTRKCRYRIFLPGRRPPARRDSDIFPHELRTEKTGQETSIPWRAEAAESLGSRSLSGRLPKSR